MRQAAILLALLVPLVASGAPAAQAANEETVHQIAAQLRCVVCQNLSVADSPSEMAKQMRGIIRDRLEAGETPEQVIAYFVDKYGEWILLAPRPQGFNLLVWIVPFAGIAAGFVAIALVARRWRRRATLEPIGEAIDPELQARIRREITELEP